LAVAWSHRSIFPPRVPPRRSNRLLIHEKLYGREREVDSLARGLDPGLWLRVPPSSCSRHVPVIPAWGQVLSRKRACTKALCSPPGSRGPANSTHTSRDHPIRELWHRPCQLLKSIRFSSRVRRVGPVAFCPGGRGSAPKTPPGDRQPHPRGGVHHRETAPRSPDCRRKTARNRFQFGVPGGSSAPPFARPRSPPAFRVVPRRTLHGLDAANP